ncbi:MAG: enoyl-CoA hydratase/isomerase family protein [Deltaproteobacteria bacterium]|nr:enoyl-CoA hydratase/isomerase family protein [Deltaproteobacteria bacterium]
MAERIHLEIDDAGVAVLTMDDPAERNALGEAFVEELTETLAKLDDKRVRVCVLRGTQEIFCAGGHKDMLEALASGDVVASDIMVSRAVLEVPVPIIAAMEGHAVGGGLTLGLCCDMVLMAEESSYGCSFMNMGFTPGMGNTRILPLAVGDYLAAEMMYGGKFFRGKHFVGRSQINYVVPKAKLFSRAMKVARSIAEKPRGALLLLKSALSIPKRQLFEEARTTESFMHEISFAQEETKALIDEYYPKI